MSEQNEIQKFRNKLNEISPSFCVAKWKQVTIHLHSGQTHSCHHPTTHKIPLKEIANNPSALHNTAFKKKQRKLMLQGKRPPECSYCWKIEDLDGDNISDRTYKSSSYWATPYLKETSEQAWDENVQPSYVELNFSNTCNLKCSYCSPHCSSKWYEEIRKHGHYPTTSRFNSLSYFDQLVRAPMKEENNPYIDAWNKWWPDLKPDLKVLRITGGEPLLSKQTFKTMDDLIDDPNKELELAINSNLCIPQSVFQKFLERLVPLTEGKVKKFDLFTSVDTWGKDAEYIRHGFDLDQFVSNVRTVLEVAPKTNLTFMCTYNALSPFNFRNLLEFVLQLRRDYPESFILLDISYLRYPPHQSVTILDGRANDLIREDVEFVKSMPRQHGEPGDGFYPNEIQKLERIYQLVQKKEDPEKLKKDQKDFFAFFKEHDKRRNTDLFKVFPELKNFDSHKAFKRIVTDSSPANIESMKKKMAEILKISPTMCTAKWLQSTLHLHNGHTHSCHHPAPHKIPLEELKENPSALHNTQFKKIQRDLMLKGERPAECEYCWNIEDMGPQFFSDRTYKSTHQDWSTPYVQKVIDAGSQENIDPSYLEVSFSNACNFKCTYCSPEVSSKWMEETKSHGPIQLSNYKLHDLNYLQEVGKKPYAVDEKNPYIESFWEWWPKLYPSLNTFRITGGEPLLSKDTWKLIEFVENNPRKDFTLVINSNLGVSDPLIDKLIASANRLKGKISSFHIYTSLESTGSQAEYARYGLNYGKFMINAHRILSETTSKLHFMVTFNVLSLSTFENFLQMVLEMRNKYNTKGTLNRVPMMIAYLRWPEMLDMRIAPQELRYAYSQKYLKFVYANTLSRKNDTGPGHFYPEEINQIERLCKYMQSEAPRHNTRITDFQLLIEQMDSRRNLDFKKNFPDLAELLTNSELSLPTQ